MLRRLAEAFPVKRGEAAITSLMFLYIFGVMTFYYIVKPLRSALFLTKFPSSHLAYAYILTALSAGTLAMLIFRATRRLSAIKTVTAVNLLLIAGLGGFYAFWASGRQSAAVPYLFFIYVQLVPGLSTAMFWLLAGYIYDSRQSKRLFPFLGAGAIVGAMAGSVIPAFLSDYLSTTAMVGISCGMLAGLSLLAWVIWRYRRPDAERSPAKRFDDREPSTGDAFRVVANSHLLTLMVLSVFLVISAAQVADWQVSDTTKKAFAHLPRPDQEREINQLLARVNFATNILGVTLQLTLTGFVVRRFGIGAAVLFMPAGLFLSSLGVLARPGLTSAIVVLGVNNVLEHSLNRAGRELLYLPLSPEVRKKLKILIDVFADKCGRGLAGLFILAVSTLVPAALVLRSTAAVIMLLSALCVAVSLRLQRAYREALRDKLSRREVDLAGVGRFVEDPESVRMLIAALDSPNERQVLYSLSLLQSIRGIDFSDRLLPLLRHPSPFVREEAARTLPALPGSRSREAEGLLSDPSDRVRSAAIEVLCSAEGGSHTASIDTLLRSEGIETRIAAARWLAQNPQVAYRPTVSFVEGLMSIGGPDSAGARVVATLLAARLPAAQSIAFLRQRLADQDPVMAEAAARAAGASGHEDLVGDVCRLLKNRRLRTSAREALLTFGPRIAGNLGDMLQDPGCEAATRRELPWILGRLATPRSSEILLAHLDAEDRHMKYGVAKALNRLREQNPSLPAAPTVILGRIYAETRAFYEALSIYQSLSDSGGEGSGQLLLRSLRERLDQDLELIFRLLGLCYAQKDIYSAYSALKGSGKERRASAIEFLDSLLQPDLKSVILPLVEETSTERLLERAARTFGLHPKSREEALRTVLDQKDAWLLACALYEIGTHRFLRLEDRCRELVDDSRDVVRETAAWTLARLESTP